MSAKVICFDFDGVLVRSRDRNRMFLWSATIEKDLGIPSDLKALLFAQPYWQDIVTGKQRFCDRLTALFSQFGLRNRVEDFIDYWLTRDLNWHNEAIAIARDLKARQVKLFIASNQDHIRSSYIRNRPEVKELFDLVITSSDLGCAKPDPAFFREATKAMSANATITFVDDDARNVASAAEAGWQGIHFDPDLDPKASFACSVSLCSWSLLSQRQGRSFD